MSQRERAKVSLLVTDIDNTLYDWVALWYASFSALLTELISISGINRDQLIEDIRRVHQRVGTTEFSFLIQEIPSLGLDSSTNLLESPYARAIDAARAARSKATKLYPGVLETLCEIKRVGVPIVCYTESTAFHVAVRLRKLGLDGVIHTLFSPDDHARPQDLDLRSIRSKPDSSYRLDITEHRLTPAGHLKPEPIVLESIISKFRVDPENVVYLGDSLTKDVAMAQELGVLDVHALYGTVHGSHEYELLRRVSHWTDSDVQREKQLSLNPTVRASWSIAAFDELLTLFRF